MAAGDRPLSPRLQVYNPQLTSVLSIMHRITGVALAVGTLLLVYWLAAAAGGPESYAAAQGFIGSFIGRLLLFGRRLVSCTFELTLRLVRCAPQRLRVGTVAQRLVGFVHGAYRAVQPPPQLIHLALLPFSCRVIRG